ncbi:MAG: hypothetical protein AB1599_07710 [Planctomycetota bacterium]
MKIKMNKSAKRQGGLPPYGLQSELLAISEAKRNIPKIDRSSGTIWSKRRGGLRRQFCGREAELWDRKFYLEWLEYVEAVESGELRGY